MMTAAACTRMRIKLQVVSRINKTFDEQGGGATETE